jgi:hypothetical protein
MFGAKPAGFGQQTTGLFGQTQPASTGFAFGQAQPTLQPQATMGSSLFAKPATSSTFGFGSGATSGFGKHQKHFL